MQNVTTVASAVAEISLGDLKFTSSSAVADKPARRAASRLTAKF